MVLTDRPAVYALAALDETRVEERYASVQAATEADAVGVSVSNMNSTMSWGRRGGGFY